MCLHEIGNKLHDLHFMINLVNNDESLTKTRKVLGSRHFFVGELK